MSVRGGRGRGAAGIHYLTCSSYALFSALLHRWFLETFSSPSTFLFTEVLKYLIKSLITSLVLFSSQGKLYFSSPASESPWEVSGLGRAEERGRKKALFKVLLFCFAKVRVDTIGRTLIHKMDQKSSMSKPTDTMQPTATSCHSREKSSAEKAQASPDWSWSQCKAGFYW